MANFEKIKIKITKTKATNFVTCGESLQTFLKNLGPVQVPYGGQVDSNHFFL